MSKFYFFQYEPQSSSMCHTEEKKKQHGCTINQDAECEPKEAHLPYFYIFVKNIPFLFYFPNFKPLYEHGMLPFRTVFNREFKQARTLGRRR